MTIKRIPRPGDSIARARLICDIATGQVVEANEDGKNAAAVELGRKGGVARSATLAPERRIRLARSAAEGRWKKGRAVQVKKEPA